MNCRSQRHLHRLLLLVLTALSLAACGTDTKFVLHEDDAVVAPDGQSVVPDGQSAAWLVLVPAPADYLARIQESVTLKVVVVNSSGGHQKDALVKFAITSDNPGSANLSTSESFTNESGEVTVDFNTGNAPATYTVNVTSDGAQSAVTLTIKVNDAPKGDLEVSLKYENPYSLGKVKLMLLEGNKTCHNLDPVYPPATPIASQTALSLQDKPKFTDLSTQTTFTVFALGYSGEQLTAAGCVDGILVQDGQTAKVTLSLYLLSLNIVGTFEMQGNFNFLNAIPGTIGDVVNKLVQAVQDPGLFIIELVETLLKEWAGLISIGINLVIDLVKDPISDWLTKQILGAEALAPVFDALSQITNLVTNLEVGYRLTFSKLSNDLIVSGTESWHRITLWWKYGCKKDDPNYATCGKKLDLDLDKLKDTLNLQYNFALVQGQFVGTISNFNTLNIERHTITLQYGKLIVYMINHVLLPTLIPSTHKCKNSTSLSQLFDCLIDCDEFAKDVAKDVAGTIFGDITQEGLKAVCNAGEGVITLVTTVLTTFIDQLTFDSRLRLQGQCTLVDDDNDLIVDRIINGTYTGNIEYEGAQGGTFSATFSGARIQPTTNP